MLRFFRVALCSLLSVCCRTFSERICLNPRLFISFTALKPTDVLALAWTVLIMGVVVALYKGFFIVAVLSGFIAYHLILPLKIQDVLRDAQSSYRKETTLPYLNLNYLRIYSLCCCLMALALLYCVGLYL